MEATAAKRRKELSPAAREARRQYMREWRARNKERNAETDRRYWERKAEQMGLTDGSVPDGKSDGSGEA